MPILPNFFVPPGARLGKKSLTFWKHLSLVNCADRPLTTRFTDLARFKPG